MKVNDVMILLAAAVIGLYLVKGKEAFAGLLKASAPSGTVKRAGDGQWHYYENGVTVDPAGNYYQNGVLIWSPYSVTS